MTLRAERSVLRVLGAYSGFRTRAHTLLRWVSTPLDQVERSVPDAGTVLDFGCGHGLLSLAMAAASPQRRVLGVDIDSAKIAAARAAAERVGLGRAYADQAVRFEQVDASWRPPRNTSFDCVVVCDVLYLLSAPVARKTALDLAEMCAPNGTIVIKEISSRTGVKRSFATAQEFFATKVFRYTQGSDIDWIDMQELAQMYRKAGFEVTVRMIDRWYPHPHQLLVARRGTSLQ